MQAPKSLLFDSRCPGTRRSFLPRWLTANSARGEGSNDWRRGDEGDHRHRVAAFVGDVGEGAILAEVNVNGRRGSPVLVAGGRNC